MTNLRASLVIGSLLAVTACGTLLSVDEEAARADAGTPAAGDGGNTGDAANPAVLCAGKDLASDPKNCGVCQKMCDGGMTCIKGACTADTCSDAGASIRGCDVGGVLTCVDTQTNQSHCGACGRACNTPCTGGDCDRLVFVTKALYNGDLGGVLGADQKCQSVASGSGKKGTFKAWISDATKGPSTSFSKPTRKYRRNDVPQTAVADDWTDLTNGGDLQSAIEFTETGEQVQDYVWTGTSAQGEPLVPNNCGDWTSAITDKSGWAGNVLGASAAWTQGMQLQCSLPQRLYCFEQ